MNKSAKVWIFIQDSERTVQISNQFGFCEKQLICFSMFLILKFFKFNYKNFFQNENPHNVVVTQLIS